MRPLSIIPFLGLALLLGCAKPEAPLPEVKRVMTLTSTTFKESEPLPRDCGAEAGNKSPELEWKHAPLDTKSFALI